MGMVRGSGVAAAIVARGGVARSRSVRAAGCSEHEIRRAVAPGEVVRVRKGWLAVPDADADLVRAARAGVVLTCVTQARRLGLWVAAGRAEAVHVAAPAHSGSVRVAAARVHWAQPVLPRDPAVLADPVENVLALVAACQPRESALVIWESAYNRGLVDRAAMLRLPLSAVARELAATATPWSDSGLETIVITRLAWLGVPIRPQVWIEGHRVDFLIGDRLVLQVDGGHHVGAQRRSDIRHDAALALLGYHVIRVDYVQITERWHEVAEVVQRAIAQGLHRIR